MVNFKTHKIFGLPPGADFPKALVDGVCAHFKDIPPHHMAQAHIILNTERMLRRVKKLFSEKPNIFHPKLHLLTNLAAFSDIQEFQKPFFLKPLLHLPIYDLFHLEYLLWNTLLVCQRFYPLNHR